MVYEARPNKSGSEIADESKAVWASGYSALVGAIPPRHRAESDKLNELAVTLAASLENKNPTLPHYSSSLEKKIAQRYRLQTAGDLC